MLDFWEIAGRLMLMDPATRKKDLYDPSGILPIQGGCILPGFCNTALLPFPVKTFYDQLRSYLSTRYQPGRVLWSPVISMFALGEIGVMFFNDDFRKLFENVSTYLLQTSAVKDRKDTGAASLFYICLALLVTDRTFRAAVLRNDFLGLQPASAADVSDLKTVAADPTFVKAADTMCLDGGWKPGSVSTLMDQSYGITPGDAISGTTTPGAPDPLPFRHYRFIDTSA
jgi:hypothetical protein